MQGSTRKDAYTTTKTEAQVRHSGFCVAGKDDSEQPRLSHDEESASVTLPPARCSIAAARSAPAGGGDRSRRRFRLSSEIQIVPRVEADLPQLFGLAKVTFAGMPGWSDERVLEVLKHDVIFVAREKGRPAGYVALRRDDGTIVVEQLFVAPGHEGRGIGHQLLAHAEGYAIAERVPSLRIVVEDANQQARSFYRRSGFVPIEPELFELILPRAD